VTAAIIVASGSSQRMGFDKLLAPLVGKPVLQRTIEAFLAAGDIGQLIVVCPTERWKRLGISDDRITRVDGGDTRQNSVNAGLEAVRDGIEWVAVHDGARPLVRPADIEDCIASAMEHGAASLAKPATETMMRADDQGFSTKPVDRAQLWCMETPQVFRLDQLRKAALHARGHGINCTDEVTAVQAVGVRVKFIESSGPNLKITTPEDLRTAEAILRIEY